MFMPNRLPGSTLTVVIRDDTPMIHCNDSPVYRSVSIELTDEQRNKLVLNCTGKTGGNAIYEAVSRCFIEPDESRVSE